MGEGLADQEKRATALQVGDVIFVPLADSSLEPAIVLFLSSGRSEIVLLGFPLDDLDALDMRASARSWLKVMLYTTRAPIDRGAWTVGRRLPVVGIEALSARIVGGTVWVQDRPVREARPADLTAIPQMVVSGVGAVPNLIQRFKSGDLSRMAEKLLDATRKAVAFAEGEAISDFQVGATGSETGLENRKWTELEVGWQAELSRRILELGHLETGHFWCAVVDALLRNDDELDTASYSLSPEAESLLISASDERSLQDLVNRLSGLGRSFEAFKLLVESADPDLF